MYIFVRLETEKTITLEMEPTNTIDDVKAKIQEMRGTPKNLQRLHHFGRPLEDARTLSDNRIKNEFTLTLQLRAFPREQAEEKK